MRAPSGSAAHCIVKELFLAQASRTLPVMASRAELLQRAMAAEGELIDAAARGHGDLQKASAAQSARLVQLIRAAPPDGALIVRLAQLFARAPFVDADAQVLASALSDVTSATVRYQRWRPQDFEAFPAFLTDAVWDTLQSTRVDFVQKSRCLMEHLYNLGLRQPSEGTVASMTAVVVIAHEGPEKARGLGERYLSDVYSHLKTAFKALPKSGPLEDVRSLRAGVDAFSRGNAATYRAVFGEGAPARCRLNMVEVAAVAKSFRWRVRKPHVADASCHGDGNMNGVMRQMMEFMMSSRTVGGEIPQRLHNGASLTFCKRRGSEALLDSPSVASGAQTLQQPYRRGSAASMPAIEDATEDVPMSTEANGGHSEAAPMSIQGVGTKAGTQAKPVSVDAAAKKVIAAMSAEKLGKAVMKKPTAKVSQATPAVMGKINVEHSRRQVVARFGAGKGSSNIFKYEVMGDLDHAKDMARNWLAKRAGGSD